MFVENIRGSLSLTILRITPSLVRKSKYCVEIGTDYVDYLECDDGDFSPVRRSGSWYIRFPIAYEGPVLIVPIENGFKVYLLKS